MRHADSAAELPAAALRRGGGGRVSDIPSRRTQQAVIGGAAEILSLAFHVAVALGGVCGTHSGGHWCSARILRVPDDCCIYYA